MAVVALGMSGPAMALDKVTFGTNWKAQAEHGGYYQALADGTYEKYGLDVTIRQGGPQVNHIQLLAAGKIDFNMGGNLFDQFNFTAEQRADGDVAAIFQKEPQVLIAHPDAGMEDWPISTSKTIFICNDGRQTYWLWLKQAYGFNDDQLEALHLQPGAVPGRQELGAAGLRHLGAVRDRAAGRLQADGADDGRLGYDTYSTTIETIAEAGRREPRPGAALRRCHHRGLVQLPLRRQQGRPTR